MKCEKCKFFKLKIYEIVQQNTVKPYCTAYNGNIDGVLITNCQRFAKK